MGLAPGTRRGPYEILGLIGAGGMGEVYKAKDTRLNRSVAIKALHRRADEDPGADRRLRGEALAAASIDHPYVCKIYELLDTDDGTLIVMEFIEGETLQSILAGGTPSLRDSLHYGLEIAEGLAEAHAHGLVHRDIKPSNVIRTPNGHVKLLDFGLARSNTLGSGNTSTQSAFTAPGAIAGTPLYMAPEQALGRGVSARSDVFSLGVVLFQCLTGRLPFEGDTRDAYVHAMLSGRRRSMDQLAPRVPDNVRRLVERCLDAEPGRRPESSALAAELRHAAELLSESTYRAKRRLSRRAIAVAATLSLMTLGGAYRFWGTLDVADALPEFTLEPAVTDSSNESEARISPDGRWLSFLSDRNGSMGLFVKQRDSPDVTPLVVRDDIVLSHTWSPDGHEVACVVRQAGGATFLQVLPAFSRGLARLTIKLSPNPEDVRISRWVESSVYLDVDLGAAGHALWRVDLREARVADVSAPWKTKQQYRSFDVSTDARMVVFDALADGREDLWTVQVDGSGLRQLTDDEFIDRSPIWLGRTNRVIFQCNRSGRLNLCQIDVRTRREGTITSGPYVEVPSAATDDGQVVAFEERTSNATLWRLDAAGARPQQLTEDSLSDFWPSVSQDGRWIAFQRTRPVLSAGFDFIDARILASRLAAGTRISAPESIGDGIAAHVSPDGTWVAYLESRGEARPMMKARNLGTGETRTIAGEVPFPNTASDSPFDIAEQNAVWTHAGAELYFTATVPEGRQIAHIDLNTAAPADVIAPPRRENLRDLRLSPDGRRLAYLSWSRLDGTFRLHMRDLQTRGDQVVRQEKATLDAGFLRGWTSDGRAVLLVRGRRDPDGTYEIDLEEVAADGGRRAIRTVDHALIVTTRLDSGRDRVFVTRVEQGVHNIVVVQLRDGTVRPVTANEQRSISFSGVEPLPDGSVVYSQVQRKRDIYLATSSTR